MAPIDVIAILNPKPGKADKLQKLLSIAAESVRANEPGVLRYHIQRQINEKKEPLFVVEETYKDQEALEAHAKREFFRDFGKILKREDLLSEPTKIIFVKEVGGYKSKL